MEFHPVQPWIAFADGSDNVRVWDWTTQQVQEKQQLKLELGAVGNSMKRAARSGSLFPAVLNICNHFDIFTVCIIDSNSCSGCAVPSTCCFVQTLHDLQLGGADDDGSLEAAMNQVSSRDTAFITNPSALSYTPSRVASGKVKQVWAAGGCTAEMLVALGPDCLFPTSTLAGKVLLAHLCMTRASWFMMQGF